MSTLPPDIGRIAGPLLVANLLHWGLFGVLSVQVYIYYLAFPKDPVKRKILVYGIYAVELVQTILFTNEAFKQFAAGFGSFAALNHIGSAWFAVPILSSTVEFMVQLFYASRIKILADSNLIPIVVVFFRLDPTRGRNWPRHNWSSDHLFFRFSGQEDIDSNWYLERR